MPSLQISLDKVDYTFVNGESVKGVLTIEKYNNQPVTLDIECIESVTSDSDATTSFTTLFVQSIEIKNTSLKTNRFISAFQFILPNGPPSFPIDKIFSKVEITYFIHAKLIKKFSAGAKVKLIVKNPPCSIPKSLQEPFIHSTKQITCYLNKLGYLWNDNILFRCDPQLDPSITSTSVKFGYCANLYRTIIKTTVSNNQAILTIPTDLIAPFESKHMSFEYMVVIVIHYKGFFKRRSTICIPITVGCSYE